MPVGTPPVAAAEAATGRLGASEAAVVIAVVAAVTLLAVLQRPIPTVLTMLAGAVGVLLAGRRAARAGPGRARRRRPRVSRLRYVRAWIGYPRAAEALGGWRRCCRGRPSSGCRTCC
ncbi:hypothetical protein RKD46_008510 [Streptomyces pseudovenezuelae]